MTESTKKKLQKFFDQYGSAMFRYGASSTTGLVSASASFAALAEELKSKFQEAIEESE